MNILSNIKILVVTALLASSFIACNSKSENAEDAEKGKVGDVYDTEEQGVQHENRDNQFPVSRNDNEEGEGLETGAPTDTIDGDGDNIKKQ